MSIKIKNIYKSYDEQIVLNNISFEVKNSEILGFLGPNGAGKTTTMKIIAGSLIQDSGSVEIDGQDILENVIEAKKKVGYLAENNPLYPEMYVKEFLYFIADIYDIKDKKKRVEDLIELTGLTKEQNKKIEQLSKGYKQRVGLAQVLMNDPEILILDEPTTGLDPNQLKEIRELIKNMGNDKIVIFSTHIMQEVKALCDRVIILNEGNIVADDKIEHLDDYVNRQFKYVYVEFDEKIEHEKLRALTSIKTIEKTDTNFYKIAGEDDYLMRKEIYNFAKENNYTLLSMHKENVDVENIFSKLTGN
jgi:ABC-2 type transport system ATP-binding protein